MAGKATWIDDTRNGEVRSSQMALGRLRITVHRHVDHEPDAWLGTCFQLGFEKWFLGRGMPVAEAKDQFLLEIVDYVDKLHKTLATVAPYAKRRENKSRTK